jgi:hypothetical protein
MKLLHFGCALNRWVVHTLARKVTRGLLERLYTSCVAELNHVALRIVGSNCRTALVERQRVRINELSEILGGTKSRH